MAAKRRERTRAPGVYRSISGKFEIQYRDSDGKLRFQVVEGGFEAAKAARADIVGKLSRGELVRRNKQTFGDFAETVMAGLTTRPRTIESHRYSLDAHLLPRFRNRKLGDITTADVARLVSEMQRGVYFERKDGRQVRKERNGGYAGWTISGTLSTMSLILRKAKRQGLIPANPCADLERDERPSAKSSAGEKRVLDDAEIAKILEVASGAFRPMLAVLIFSGLRMGECLGLRWQDIGEKEIHVRHQLGRDGQLVALKTDAGRRDVALASQLAAVLKEHKVASRHCGDTDYVFAAPDGTGRDHRAAARGIGRSATAAGLDGVSAHSCRHTFASRLIALGLDPVRVSKQLGHASPSFTEDAYSHVFERARHADELREKLELGYGRLLDVNRMSTSSRNQAKPAPAKVAAIKPIRG
jgi:integrase